MIKSLTIQNILSHKKTTFNFSPGVTMIIGPSGAGKSAMMNSLNWIFTLRPSGDDHRSWNGGVMRSVVEFDSGDVVTLTKDKQNVYFLTNKNDKTLKPVRFKAFGQNPPQEIKEVINIDSKVNIQKQLDKRAPIFLLSEPPGDIAKFFNKVAGLYKIDETQTIAKADVRTTDNEVKSLKKQIENKRLELEKYKGVGALYKKILKAREIDDFIAENRYLIDKLESLLYLIQDTQEKIIILQQKTKIKNEINKALICIRIKQEVKEEKEKLKSCLVGIKQSKDFVQAEEYKQEILPDINMSISLYKAINYLETEKNKIIVSLSDIKTLKERIEQKEKEKETKESLFNKNFPDVCPLCGE